LIKKTKSNKEKIPRRRNVTERGLVLNEFLIDTIMIYITPIWYNDAMKSLFLVRGKVMKGKNRGKELGFPTANIILTNDIPDGIYAAKVSVSKKEYLAATFVGASETFGETDKKIESFLLNFHGDLYETEITIRLYKRIRGNTRFSSVEMLKTQMKKDLEDIKKYFAENS